MQSRIDWVGTSTGATEAPSSRRRQSMAPVHSGSATAAPTPPPRIRKAPRTAPVRRRPHLVGKLELGRERLEHLLLGAGLERPQHFAEPPAAFRLRRQRL